MKVQKQLRIIKDQLLKPNAVYMNDINRTMKQQLNLPSANLKQISRDAGDLRKDYLLLRYEQLVIENRMTKAKVVKIIAKAEKRNRAFAAYKKLIQPRASGGLSYLLQQREVGKDDKGDSIYVTDRIHQIQELEDILYERNRIHFSQASKTPFAVSPLEDLLQHSGVTDFGDLVMHGEAIPEQYEIPDTARKLLQQLKQVQPELPSELPFETMI